MMQVGWVKIGHFQLRVWCMVYRLTEKIFYGTRLTEINNVVDDGLLLISPKALEATL